jgi:hypothetical protein
MENEKIRKRKLMKEINEAKSKKNFSLVTKLKRKLNNKESTMITKLKEDLEKNVLEEENKGFQLLKKMGFNKGEGLGKDGKGSKEPVKINISGENRIGKTEEEKKLILEQEEKMNQLKKYIPTEVKDLEQTKIEYLEFMKQKYLESRQNGSDDDDLDDYFDS